MERAVKLPYTVVLKGVRYFQPTPKMKRFGFAARSLGPDGPEAQAEALRLYGDWRRQRKGLPSAAEAARAWPLASVGHAFERYKRTAEWNAKAAKTRWEWDAIFARWIGPLFGSVAPATIQFEMASALRETARTQVSLHHAHRTIKIWRALWKVMAAMRLCEAAADPSLAIRNSGPRGRAETWSEGEAVRLVKAAWRAGYAGLAAALAVMWDTQFSPVDVRGASLAIRRRDAKGDYFESARAKSGGDALGTLSKRAVRILDAYIASLGVALLADAPIFRNRSGAAYSSDTLGDDFRVVRGLVFPGDRRQMRDFRRSGAIEAVAGEVDATALSQKMGNSLAQSRKLQDTYLPKRAATVRLADEARKRGRRRLGEAG